jgi:hypothetical protein
MIDSRAAKILDLLAEADRATNALIHDILMDDVTYDEDGFVLPTKRNKQLYELVDALDDIEIYTSKLDKL